MYDINGEKKKEIGFFAGSFQLGVEWFVIDNLSIEGSCGFQKSGQGSDEITGKFIYPMIYYYFNIGQVIPYVGSGFEYAKYDFDSNGDLTETFMLFIIGAVSMSGVHLAVL